MMKLLKQAQSSKGTKDRGIKNSVPLWLCSSVSNKKGLTLLEIAMSMAILAIAFVALSSLFPIGLKFSRRASTFSEASILAQRVIENIKRAASVYDGGMNGDHGSATMGLGCSNGDGIGYFELVARDTAPYSDEATIDPLPPSTLPQDFWTYQYPDMRAVVTKENVDINNDGNIDPDKKLKLKVYVAVYWKEADKDRADTFITYISNPFYEKYK